MGSEDMMKSKLTFEENVISDFLRLHIFAGTVRIAPNKETLLHRA